MEHIKRSVVTRKKNIEERLNRIEEALFGAAVGRRELVLVALKSDRAGAYRGSGTLEGIAHFTALSQSDVFGALRELIAEGEVEAGTVGTLHSSGNGMSMSVNGYSLNRTRWRYLPGGDNRDAKGHWEHSS